MRYHAIGAAAAEYPTALALNENLQDLKSRP